MRTTLLSALLLVATSLAAQEYTKVPESWNRPVSPFRIIDNIYYVGSSDLTSYLITTPSGHILLDSGAPETVPQILQNISRLGFKPEDVEVLINSHAHFDHAGGLGALRRLTGAKLLMSREDAALAARGGKNDPQFGDRFLFEPFRTDGAVRDQEPVKLGGVSMVPHITPGHTKGCTTWTMNVNEGGQQYKAVFVCSVSAPDYKLVDNPAYPNAIEDYRRTFKTLRALKPDVFLASHASFFNMLAKKDRPRTPNPFIDREGYVSFLDRWQKTVEEQYAAQQH